MEAGRLVRVGPPGPANRRVSGHEVAYQDPTESAVLLETLDAIHLDW